mgnify:FL=1
MLSPQSSSIDHRPPQPSDLKQFMKNCTSRYIRCLDWTGYNFIIIEVMPINHFDSSIFVSYGGGLVGKQLITTASILISCVNIDYKNLLRP